MWDTKMEIYKEKKKNLTTWKLRMCVHQKPSQGMWKYKPLADGNVFLRHIIAKELVFWMHKIIPYIKKKNTWYNFEWAKEQTLDRRRKSKWPKTCEKILNLS